MSGAPVFDLQNDLHVRRATRPNCKHIACSPGALKRRALGCLCLAAWLCAATAHAQPVPPAEVPRPEEPPVFVQPSAVGELEYRAGRGLRVGNTGFTIGGFATLLADRKEESGDTRVTLDDLNLFTLFDPTPFFQKYSENAWAGVKGYLDEVTRVAAAPVIEKYTGVLAAADVFTESTTFWVMESIRLDLGYGSQVHP